MTTSATDSNPQSDVAAGGHYVHWPYRADIMDGEAWWPESSHPEDSMVIGDGIPGDKKTAELCARCCNIAYEQALEDVTTLLAGKGLDVSKALAALILPNKKLCRADGGNGGAQPE